MSRPPLPIGIVSSYSDPYVPTAIPMRSPFWAIVINLLIILFILGVAAIIICVPLWKYGYFNNTNTAGSVTTIHNSSQIAISPYPSGSQTYAYVGLYTPSTTNPAQVFYCDDRSVNIAYPNDSKKSNTPTCSTDQSIARCTIYDNKNNVIDSRIYYPNTPSTSYDITNYNVDCASLCSDQGCDHANFITQ
jgi:hypothetical protein